MSGKSGVVVSVKPANKVVLNGPAEFNCHPAMTGTSLPLSPPAQEASMV